MGRMPRAMTINQLVGKTRNLPLPTKSRRLHAVGPRSQRWAMSMSAAVAVNVVAKATTATYNGCDLRSFRNRLEVSGADSWTSARCMTVRNQSKGLRLVEVVVGVVIVVVIVTVELVESLIEVVVLVVCDDEVEDVELGHGNGQFPRKSRCKKVCMSSNEDE